MFSVVLAGVFALQSAEGPPQAPLPAPREAQAKDKDKLVCRRVGSTGTRVGGAKRCLTREQWSQQGSNANDGMARAGTISSN